MSKDNGQINAATFGVLMARAIKAAPWSNNWALVYHALEGTEYEVSENEDIPQLIDRIAAVLIVS